MSRMNDLVIDLMDEIREGFLSFDEIATKYEVPVAWVNEAAEMVLSEMIAETTMDG